jgi:hypothetical protein
MSKQFVKNIQSALTSTARKDQRRRPNLRPVTRLRRDCRQSLCNVTRLLRSATC